jgi:hypothetical protein
MTDERPGQQPAFVESVQRVGSRGRSATITGVLLVAAFALGLVRPWDWLGAGASSGTANPPDRSAGVAAGIATPQPTASPTPGPGTDAAAAETCAYPQSWRSATLQRWAGREAQVWTAVEAVSASGPSDPAIPFQVVGGDEFRAIGWCAPVLGDDRPPLDARGRLFRLDGANADEVAYRLIAPAAPNALGELLAPDGPDPAFWPPGRYVFELATPTGSWQRWLGLELREAGSPVATPAASPSGAGSGSPSGAGSTAP